MARGGLRGMRSTRVSRPRATRARRARNTRVRFGVPVRGLRGVNRRVRAPGLGSTRPSLGRAIQRFQSVNGNLTNSSVVLLNQRPNRQVSTLKQVGAPNFFTDQYPLRVDYAYGFQEVVDFNVGSTALLRKLTTLPVNVPGQTTNIPFRICIESYIGNLTMANASTAPVELCIYDIGLKRDIQTSLQIQGNATQVYDFGGGPASFWAAGSQMANNLPPIAAGVGGAYRNIGASPFDSPLFKDYYYVKKRTHVLLSQGGIHRHSFTGKVNRLIDTTMLNQWQTAGPGVQSWTNGYKGFSSFVMVVQKGLPVSDATEAANVTTSDTHVDYIMDYRFKWSYVLDHTLAVYNADTLTSPASAQIINVGNGLPEPIAFTV